MNILKKIISNLILKIDLSKEQNLYNNKILEQINEISEMYKFILKVITTIIGITQLQLLFYFAFVEKIETAFSRVKESRSFGFKPLISSTEKYPQWIDNFFQVSVIISALFLCLAFVIIILYILSKRYSSEYAVEIQVKQLEIASKKQEEQEKLKYLQMLDEELREITKK